MPNKIILNCIDSIVGYTSNLHRMVGDLSLIVGYANVLVYLAERGWCRGTDSRPRVDVADDIFGWNVQYWKNANKNTVMDFEKNYVSQM